MAKLGIRRFVPTPADAEKGETPMSKSEIASVLLAYKKQNPVKYEAKKEALLKMWGLTAEPKQKEDPSEVELESIKKNVTEKKDAQ